MKKQFKRARLAVQRQLTVGLVTALVLNVLQAVSNFAFVTYMAWAGDAYCLFGGLLWTWLWWQEGRARR